MLSREDKLRKEYEERLAKLRSEQAACNHEWGPVTYDPEIKSEPYGSRMVGQGSHVWFEPEGYHEVSYPRWSRTCTKCGKVEYTKEQVAVKFEPKFD